MVGCNHRQASVDLRERLAFPPEAAEAALRELHRRYPDQEAVLLSTCNRVELYTAANDERALPTPDALLNFLADWHQLPIQALRQQLVEHSGSPAVNHLFHVASSLDSMVVGEAQISSQVKQAYELAIKAETAGPLMHAAFQAASRVAKRVARETAIHRRRVSIPSVAICEVAAEFFSSLDDKRILVIGAGEMAEESLRYLRDTGASDVVITNRTMARADQLVAGGFGRAVPWEKLDEQLVAADLVISTTSAEEPIVSLQRFLALHEARFQRLLLILDLAVPRDFDPEIDDLPGTYLYSVDDLQAACNRNLVERTKEYPKAERIIQEEASRLMADVQHRGTGPVIRQLRDQADQVKQEELSRLLARLERTGIDPQSRTEIEQAFERLVNKLLHPPLASLRQAAEQDSAHHGLLDALRRLFQLD
jgi:glutamyl-tRNA reductase